MQFDPMVPALVADGSPLLELSLGYYMVWAFMHPCLAKILQPGSPVAAWAEAAVGRSR